MLDGLEASLWLAHHEAFGRWVDRALAWRPGGAGRGSRTLLLGRGDVARLLRPHDWVDAVERGFRAAAEGKAGSPQPMEIAGEGGAFHAKGAWIALGRRYAALKLNGNFPANGGRGLPTIQGAILLCDGETGALLAIMDSIEVTLRRTAAATVLAARHLARTQVQTLLVCGCGAQGRAQLAALRAEFPIRRCLAWDRDPDCSRRFAAEQGAEAVAAIDGEGIDLVVTCTTATSPFLGPQHVAPGAFVAAIGADSPAKSEIAPELFAGALVVADVAAQCAAMGDLRAALAAGIGADCVHAELAELVTGVKPGRTSDAQVTLFDSTGTALEDVASAAMIYERAMAEGGARSTKLAAA